MTLDDQANQFAIALLMPESLLKADIQAMGGIDLVDDADAAKLARRYGVSIALLGYRLGQIDASKR